MTCTKVDMNHSRIARIQDLDELATVLFPNNKNHQKTFLAVFVELKWAPDQFLPALEPIAQKHGLSRRTLETVRAKMRRMGLIDHVSRFNKKHGYREGWVFSKRFEHTLVKMARLTSNLRECRNSNQERKDQNSLSYL
ncbi:MAG: hypothetical protein IT365_29475 [Candidatus Hydrogenedentes bacterium]|nr:hypothetical protein [Candidatus Hydrogenedentota bacterium]